MEASNKGVRTTREKVRILKVISKNLFFKRKCDRIVRFRWALSSVGQSYRLITGWSGVRIPEGPPKKERSKFV